MENKKVALVDDQLEKVSGGYFGVTAHTVAVNEANYNSVIRSASDVVILFGACWGGPCVLMNATMEELAAENQNTVVGISDVDENPKLAERLGITSIPTTIKYTNGIEALRIIGNHPVSELGTLF